MTAPTHSVALWQQLQSAARVLAAVRAGQSATAGMDSVAPALRPGVQALLFHALRHLGRAQALREQLARRAPAAPADALLCLALALIWDEAHAPYDAHTLVDQAVEAAKRDRGLRQQANFINACLRRFLRERASLIAATDALPQARWNHPAWWIERLRKDHPQRWQAILQANNTQAPMSLRINQRKTTRAAFLATLQAHGLPATEVGEQGVILAHPQPVNAIPGFADGLASVQDAAAQRAAQLLAAALQSGANATACSTRPQILDACAAPGGKTAHLFVELIDLAVTALDIDPARCQRIHQNLERVGQSARVIAADAANPAAWWDGQPFDAILLDAPCTASGIVRRHPDVRWLRRETDIAQLAAVQARLLIALWPLVRPGGWLLYCTCSVFKAEGEEQIQTFAENHSDALLRPAPGHLIPQSATIADAVPDNLPGDHDGFYYALLEKIPA